MTPNTRLRPPTALVTMLVAAMGLRIAFEPASVLAQGQDSGKKITISKTIDQASPQTLQSHWTGETINPQTPPSGGGLTGARGIEVNSFGMPVQLPTETGTAGRGTGGKSSGGMPDITKDSVSISKTTDLASPQILQAHWSGETVTPAQGTGTASGGIPSVTGTVPLGSGILIPPDTGSKKPKGKSP
jgi:type VI protein secretion system component Hcp